ncbi:MAG: PilN domain-containing protein [Bacillota bacterium]
MGRINLLPKEYLSQRHGVRHTLGTVALLTFTLGILLGIGFQLQRYSEALEARLAVVRAEYDRNREFIELQRRLLELRQEVARQEAYRRPPSGIRYREILSEIGQLVPAGITLNQTEIGPEELTLTGQAPSLTSIAQLIVSLDHGGTLFHQAKLVSATETTGANNARLVAFKVICLLKPAGGEGR